MAASFFIAISLYSPEGMIKQNNVFKIFFKNVKKITLQTDDRVIYLTHREQVHYFTNFHPEEERLL